MFQRKLQSRVRMIAAAMLLGGILALGGCGKGEQENASTGLSDSSQSAESDDSG